MSILKFYWICDCLCLLKETRPTLNEIVVKYSCCPSVFPIKLSKRKLYALIFHLLFPKIHTFKRSLKNDHSYCSMVDRKITFFLREREGIMNIHGEVTHEVPQGFVRGPMLFYVILYIHKLFMEGVNNMHHQQIFKQ